MSDSWELQVAIKALLDGYGVAHRTSGTFTAAGQESEIITSEQVTYDLDFGSGEVVLEQIISATEWGEISTITADGASGSVLTMAPCRLRCSSYTSDITYTLKGESVPIHDSPIVDPVANDYPYIEFGEAQVIPVDASGATTGDNGVEEYFDIHVYSRYRGQREMKQIQGDIYDALHHKSLSVIGRNTAFCWLDDVRTLNDPDGLTRQGIQTFKITHRS